MKRAIGYIRISDKDQSNFSLEGQERYIRDFCSRNNYDLTEVFIDDGKSAKNFDRPDWIKLEQFITRNKNLVDYLIVVKYDRFSRHAADGLNKIETLEHKHGILILSVFEQMLIDHNSPFFFKQRADILVNAEFELRVIRDRTRFGIHEAKLKGRYIHKAPFGYLNKLDENKKPILVLDPEKASIVKMMYDEYLKGTSIRGISIMAKAKGFTNKGKSSITRILSNCVYAGMINVPAYRDNKESMVKGLHTAIIDHSDWMEVQYKLGTIKQPKIMLNDDIPLRSVLKCECGHPFTGAKSKGKRKWYYYYRCNNHSGSNFSANKLHSQFDEILSSLSLSPAHLEYLVESARRQMAEQMQERNDTLKKKKQELSKAQAELESLEQKYIQERINQETYSKWFPTYSRNIRQLKQEIGTISTDQSELMDRFEAQIPRLKDLKFLYHNATLLQKHLFIRMVFNSKLSYSQGSYRTPYILPIFVPNLLAMKEKSLLILDEQAVNQPGFPVCTPQGDSIEHLDRFLSLIAEIKAA